jgi:hypothetical protein
MNEKNNTNPKILHGNSARVDPKRPVTPVFETLTGENMTDRFGRTHKRHDDDEYSEFIQHEVESIRL